MALPSLKTTKLQPREADGLALAYIIGKYIIECALQTRNCRAPSMILRMVFSFSLGVRVPLKFGIQQCVKEKRTNLLPITHALMSIYIRDKQSYSPTHFSNPADSDVATDHRKYGSPRSRAKVQLDNAKFPPTTHESSLSYPSAFSAP